MTWLRVRRAKSPADFRQRAEPWLLQREAEHNLLLGVIPGLVDGSYPLEGPAYLATIESNDRVVGCAFRTPPFHLGVTRLPAGAIAPLVEDVARTYDRLSGVIGPPADALGVAQHWARLHGGQSRIAMQQGIYELRDLDLPVRMPAGAMRWASPADAPGLYAWGQAFVEETGIPAHDVNGLTDRFVAEGSVVVWEHDGAPRAMAVATGPTPHGIRIGFVYTPPACRGQGLASALVAELSRAQFEAGRALCFLYTDLTNPTSNRIYQRLGYRQVGRSAEIVVGE
ncbi:MAG: GNAT family N-acetyltransferase [Acidobacteria bacterium]|nr:GNAT family N-acetyltransferase [Acidobacteriota bacterium]